MANGNYNIFIELGLTPPLPAAEVMTALDKKINHWNNMRTRQPMGQAKWEHFKRIKADIAANPNLISEHAARFAAEKGRELEEKKIAMRQAAQIYVVNGRIEEAQLKMLARQWADFSENDILSIIGARLKAERKFAYSEDPSVVETPAIVLKPVADLLRQAGKRDLYDFLNVSPSAPKTQIAQVCDTLYRSSQTSGSLQERTLNSSLIGHARNLLLSSDASRAGYDKALANAGFAPVRDQMKTLSMGSVKVIAPSQYSTLLQQVTRAGIQRAKAEYLIFTEAKKLGLTIVEEADDTTVCRFCGSLNQKDATSCKNCGMPVVVVCPQCGNRSDNPEELRCTRCGFAIGDMPRAVSDTEAASRAIGYGNLAEAERLIASAAAAWPGYKDLDRLQRQVAEARVATGKIVARLRELISEKKYYAARRELAAASGNAEAEQLSREINSAVDRAEEALRQAASATDPNRRIAFYCQALDFAADCEVASRQLRMTPPAAPARVDVSVDGRNIHIEWRKIDAPFLSYVVVRKPDARPTSPRDGEVIGETSGNSVDDITAQPGRSYFYTVFARCGDVYSTSGTSTDYPAMTGEEIDPSKIDFDIRERQIDFVFNAPKAVYSIDIFRNGTKVANIIGDSYRDAGLTPDTRYTYRFVAIYKDITGREVRTSGTEMTLMPMALPSAVDLTVSVSSGKALISWGRPSKGSVTVFVSDRPLGFSRGEKINVDTLRATPLRVSGNEAEMPLDFNGLKYLLPVTVVGNIGIAGSEEVVKNLALPADVRVTRDGSRVSVSWRSNGSASTLVKWSVDRGREQSREVLGGDATHLTVDIPAEARMVEFRLCSFVTTAQGKEYGEEVLADLSLKPSRVEFLDFSSEAVLGLFGKDKFSVSLRCDTRPSSDLALIVKEGAVPVDLVNYNPLLTIRRGDLEPGVTLKLPFRYSRRNSDRKLFVRLIAIDRAAASSIVISPESRNIK